MIYSTRNKKGFTLVELMVVSAIIALLTSVVLGSLGNAKSKGRDTERVQEMKQLQTALELYRLEFGYPEVDGGLARITSEGGGAGFPTLSSVMQGLVARSFLSEIPLPPKGSAYNDEVYSYQTMNDGTDLSCQGKSLESGSIPYILYFYTELPQNLAPLMNNGDEVPHTYCLTI